jgi:hypothetical protein
MLPLYSFSMVDPYARIRVTKGRGIVDDAYSFFSGRTSYPDERHSIGIMPPYTGVVYNFNGPKTHIDERIARGDVPVNEIDAKAKIHDIAYREAQKSYDRNPDKAAFKERIWDADKKYIQGVKSVAFIDPPVASISIAAMSAKMAAEKAGILDSKRFSGRAKVTKKKHPAYVMLALKQLKKGNF